MTDTMKALSKLLSAKPTATPKPKHKGCELNSDFLDALAKAQGTKRKVVK